MENQKYVLITDATSGIGKELARCFAKDDCNLIIVARDETELNACANELKQQYGIEIMPIACDLFKRGTPLEVYNQVKQRGIQVDVLINNAGQGQFGEFINTDLDRELDIVQLNIGAYISLAKYFLQDMVSRGRGRIINVASVGAKVPGVYQSVYHGTKAFVQSWSEAVRSELKDKGVTVTSLLPGITDTDFFNRADMQHSKLAQPGMADAESAA